MENVSELLWHEMNRYIGVEEKIFIIRKRFELSEKVILFKKHLNERRPTKLISGSRAEGLDLPGIDFDIMNVCDSIFVTGNDRSLAQANDIIMDTNDIKPGFARLYCSSEVIKYLGNPFHNVTKSRDCLLPLSSLLLRNQIVSYIKESTNSSAIAHGPCATFKTPNGSELDFLVCFSCNTWPKLASEWIHRNRKNNWPSNDLVAEIVHGGCLVVPIGNPNSQESEMQWRISFSVAEKKLIHSFNHTQLLCYGFLKLYLKHVINSNIDVKGLLCSYFLKTSLFYCIEEVHIVWKKETFLHCIFICIERIIKWVRDEYCPNYFITDNNMFEGKICGDKGKKLLKYLCELYNDGLFRFCQIPCLSTFSVSMNGHSYCISISTMGATTDAEKEVTCDSILTLGIPVKNCIENHSECIHNVVHISTLLEQSIDPIDKAILTCSLPGPVFCLVQHMYHKVHGGNKENKPNYRQIRALRNLIIKNCITFDVCSGKLLLATICLLDGEYSDVIAIAENVMKKILSSSMFEGHGRPICKIHPYIDTLCGKGFTLNQKLERGILAKSFECFLQCKCYPKEIEPELLLHAAMGSTFIPPIVYSRVLLFLTYRQLSSREKMIDNLTKLYDAVQDNFFVTEIEKPLAYSLLQKCIDLWETSQGF